MSNIITKLENGEHPSQLELIDHVIQIQLIKINKHNRNQHPVSITESTEQAMSNLIDLIELRQDIYPEGTPMETINMSN